MGWASSYISELEAGKEVSFRPRGNSMVPLIHSGDLVTVSPNISNLTVGDMVLCKVAGRQYVHKVLAIQGKRYQIGNNRGGVNGWTTSIYGKVTKVSK